MSKQTPLVDIDPELADKYDIERYRKLKRRKKLYFRLLIGLLCLIILSALFFLGEMLVQKQNEKTKTKATFPISLKNESPIDLLTYRDNLFMLGDAKSVLYQTNAKRAETITHGIPSPIVKMGDNKILSYTQGGYVVRLDDQNGELKTLKLETQVLFAEISDNGLIAVVTFEERFNATLTIYDSKFKEIYKYNESQNYMIGFDFVSNNKGVILLQSTDSGQMSTIVRGLDFRKEDETEYFETILSPGVVAYKVEVQKNSDLALVTNSGVITLSDTGEEKQNYTFHNDVRFIDLTQKNNVIAVENIINSEHTDLMVFNETGEMTAEYTLNDHVLDLYTTESRIYILTKKKVYSYNFKFEDEQTYTNEFGSTKLTVVSGDVFGMTSEYLYKFKKD